jgi:hypothetical protein
MTLFVYVYALLHRDNSPNARSLIFLAYESRRRVEWIPSSTTTTTTTAVGLPTTTIGGHGESNFWRLLILTAAASLAGEPGVGSKMVNLTLDVRIIRPLSSPSSPRKLDPVRRRPVKSLTGEVAASTSATLVSMCSPCNRNRNRLCADVNTSLGLGLSKRLGVAVVSL